MRTIIWHIHLWLYLIWIIPPMKLLKKLSKQGRIKERDRIVSIRVKKWARAVLRVAGAKVQVQGLENIPKVPVVFVGNHQGNFDIPLLLGYLDEPHGFLAKVETLKIPLVRTWMKYLNCVFIDRKDVRQSLTAINDSADLLKAGYSLIIFPEGTRSRGREMGEFKNGAFKMAFKNNTPVVPFVIDGTYKIMEESGGWIKPAHISLKILEPIETKGLDKTGIKELQDVVKKEIQRAL